MRQYRSRAALKNLAKDKLIGKFSHALFVLFLADLINQAAISAFISVFPVGGLMWGIISILASSLVSIFLGILQTGIAYYFLNTACNRRQTITDIFYGFRKLPEKSIMIAFVQVAISTVCLLPYQICMLLFLDTFNNVYLTAALITMFIGYLFMVPVKLAISQSYYLLLDFPDSTAKDAILTSIRVMKGHKRRLFLLELSFLPLQLLCILTLGIGFLWLNPYMQMTYTLFFLDLMNPETTHTDSNQEQNYNY